jgi:hypothetical protein
MAKRYETRGGDYEDMGANKNSTQRGPWERISRGSKKKDDKK